MKNAIEMEERIQHIQSLWIDESFTEQELNELYKYCENLGGSMSVVKSMIEHILKEFEKWPDDFKS